MGNDVGNCGNVNVKGTMNVMKLANTQWEIHGFPRP